MAHYGELLDTKMMFYGEDLHAIDEKKEQLYKSFDDYFNHPIMTKIKNINGYSMYMCKTYCLLSNECRYIIVFVKQDDRQLQSREKLSNLFWESLQTRTLPDQYNLNSHGYQPKKLGDLNVPIHRESVTKECSVYNCDSLDIIVTLLHNEKYTSYDYQQHGNVIAALETYNTIITLKNN